jgi:hypothetical protein
MYESLPVTGLDRPVTGSRRLRLLNSRHMKVVKFSALCTGCLIPQEVSLVLFSVTG